MIKAYPANNEIRQKMQLNGISLWEVAHELEISEPTLFRWLRFELNPERKAMIENAITAILAGRASHE